MNVSTYSVKAQSKYKKGTTLQYTSVFLLSFVAEGIFELLELNSDGSVGALRRGRPRLKVVNKGLDRIFCALLGERRRCEGLDTQGWVQRNVHDQGKNGHVCKNSYENDARSRSSRCQVALLLYIFVTMGLGRWLALLILHPFEFRILLQFHLYHEQKRDIKALKEHPTSGWDRKSMRRCWEFLEKTSRSFSAVIKELDGDLARTVSITRLNILYTFRRKFELDWIDFLNAMTISRVFN